MTLPDEEFKFEDEENPDLSDFDDDKGSDLSEEEEQTLFPEEDN